MTTNFMIVVLGLGAILGVLAFMLLTGMVLIRERQVGKEGAARISDATQSQSPKQSAGDQTNHIVPIKKLEAIPWSELEGISPRSPAQHADDHERKIDSVGLWLEQSFLLLCIQATGNAVTDGA